MILLMFGWLIREKINFLTWTLYRKNFKNLWKWCWIEFFSKGKYLFLLARATAEILGFERWNSLQTHHTNHWQKVTFVIWRRWHILYEGMMCLKGKVIKTWQIIASSKNKLFLTKQKTLNFHSKATILNSPDNDYQLCFLPKTHYSIANFIIFLII